jgi:hypothetical protein
MYDKARAHWQRYRDLLLAQLPDVSEATRVTIAQCIAAMDSTDMAVIVSQAQGELEEFQKSRSVKKSWRCSTY